MFHCGPCFRPPIWRMPFHSFHCHTPFMNWGCGRQAFNTALGFGIGFGVVGLAGKVLDRFF